MDNLRPKRTNLRLARAERPDLRPKRPDLRPERPDLRITKPDLRPKSSKGYPKFYIMSIMIFIGESLHKPFIIQFVKKNKSWDQFLYKLG